MSATDNFLNSPKRRAMSSLDGSPLTSLHSSTACFCFRSSCSTIVFLICKREDVISAKIGEKKNEPDQKRMSEEENEESVMKQKKCDVDWNEGESNYFDDGYA